MHYEIAIAFILDIIIGDPEYPFHPVRLIGKCISFLEEKFRKISETQKLNGLFFAAALIIAVYIITKLLLITASRIDLTFNITIIKSLFIVILIYFGISIKDLRDKAMLVYYALGEDNLKLARKHVSVIVGRDSDKLNKKEITRACVETVSESITDGIISPLFFAFMGGAPAIMIFKTVSTLDSMIGYKNEKYKDFGYASARLDDIANYIPARIAGYIITVISLFRYRRIREPLKILHRDGMKNPSPNSGITQAAMAGALGIELGGTNYYNGEKSEKSVIGDKTSEIEPEHIKHAIRIAYLTGIIFLITGFAIVFFINYHLNNG